MDYLEYKVIVTKSARLDYYEAEEYIATKLYSHSGAANLAKSVREAIKDLQFFPTKYPLCNDELLRAWGIRFVPVKNYLLFYVAREDEGTVYVIRFLYAKRAWQNILREYVKKGGGGFMPVFTTHYIQEETEKYGAK